MVYIPPHSGYPKQTPPLSISDAEVVRAHYLWMILSSLKNKLDEGTLSDSEYITYHKAETELNSLLNNLFRVLLSAVYKCIAANKLSGGGWPETPYYKISVLLENVINSMPTSPGEWKKLSVWEKMSNVSILLNAMHTSGSILADYANIHFISDRYPGGYIPNTFYSKETNKVKEMLNDLSGSKLPSEWDQHFESTPPQKWARKLIPMQKQSQTYIPPHSGYPKPNDYKPFGTPQMSDEQILRAHYLWMIMESLKSKIEEGAASDDEYFVYHKTGTELSGLLSYLYYVLIDAVTDCIYTNQEAEKESPDCGFQEVIDDLEEALSELYLPDNQWKVLDIWRKMSIVSLLLNLIHYSGYVARDYAGVELKSPKYKPELNQGDKNFGKLLDDLAGKELPEEWGKFMETTPIKKWSANMNGMLRHAAHADTLTEYQTADIIEKTMMKIAKKAKNMTEEAYQKFFDKHGIETKGVGLGFSEKEQKWYGWSHRAIHGFGIGDKVKKGDLCATTGWTDEYLKEHPEADTSLPVGFKAKTLEDAKKMAEAFSEAVS